MSVVPLAGEARRRDPADHRQRLELREERPGAPRLRRRPHPVPRVRPRAARAPVGRDLSASRRHRACRPTSSSCRRSSTSTGSSSRRCCAASPLHYRTGEPMPEALLERVLAARSFNQGFATVEYTSSALVDMDLHQLGSADDLDVGAFEKEALAAHRHAARDRHAAPHAAFLPHLLGRRLFGRLLQLSLVGGARRRRLRRLPRGRRHLRPRHRARSCTTFIYAAGNRRPPDDAYRAFRGRMPSIQALLKKRGLAEAPTDARAGV